MGPPPQGQENRRDSCRRRDSEDDPRELVVARIRPWLWRRCRRRRFPSGMFLSGREFGWAEVRREDEPGFEQLEVDW